MKVMRKNRTKSDCGLIATFNAASWCKRNIPYNRIKTVASDWFGYGEGRGMLLPELPNLLKKLRIPFSEVKKNPLEIQEEIYSGKAFVIGYKQTGEDFGHAILVLRDKHGKIATLNAEEGFTWNHFAAEIEAGGMESIVMLELPRR
jgi:hypothetical protein